MAVRIERMDFDRGKKGRFARKELDLEDAIARRLVDTQYISREVAGYLNLLYPKELRVGQKAVFTNKGGVTAELRHLWGLNSILGKDGKKNRADHRHHAVDACVIACTDRKHMKRLAESTMRGFHHRELAPPWADFRKDAEHIVKERKRAWNLDGREVETQGILISHSVNRKIMGGFHEGTNYGPTEKKNKFTYRVSLESLSPSKIGKIRDPKIRDIVRQRCMERDFDPDSGGSSIPKHVFKDPLTMPSGVPIRKDRSTPSRVAAVRFASVTTPFSLRVK